MNAAKNTPSQITAIRYADLDNTPTAEIHAHIGAVANEYAGNEIKPEDMAVFMHTLVHMLRDITMGDLSSMTESQTESTIRNMARAMKTVLDCRHGARAARPKHVNDKRNIPAAACGRCGGWSAVGGMSQHSRSIEPVECFEHLRTGCTCR